MIETMIITLREGIEIALVLGILIVYLRKIDQPSLVVSVYAGLILAVIASIGGAFVLQKLAIDQESLEGYFMLAAAGFVISMIVWMWITAKKIRATIETKISSIVESKTSWNSHLGVLTFTFLMIVREGLETAIFLQAVMFSTSAWGGVTGIVLGLSLATIFAVLFIRGSIKIDIGRFLKVTAITLLLFTLQLIINAIHEFYEYGVFPANPKMMSILGPIVQNDELFVIAIIIIPALMLVVPGRKAKTISTTRGQRTWQLSAGFASLVVVLFLGVGNIFSSNTNMDLSSEEITIPPAGTFQIPIAKISDGTIHRYSIHDKGLELRFFVIRTSLGKFAAACDACYACYSYGRYYLKNGELICSQCEAPSPLSKLHPAVDENHPDETDGVSMEGNGCAPIYLPSRMHDGNIEIRLADLQRNRKYFEIDQESK